MRTALEHGTWRLEYSNGARRTSNTTLYVQRRTSHEESVASQILALLTQLLKIPHLANGSAPVDQEPLVQTPTFFKICWPGFEGDVIGY